MIEVCGCSHKKGDHPKMVTRERESDKHNLSFHPYHKIRQMRTPNLPFSILTWVSNVQSLLFAMFFTCSTASWVFIHKITTEELVTMLSQSTTIRTPSGFKSSDFNIPCLNLIVYRTINLYHPCRR